MTVFCTYCSAEKDAAVGDLAAIDRYQGARLRSVYDAAQILGLRFLILSGKYGLLQPGDPIPWYDHLLQSSEVTVHSELVAGQLQELGVQDLIFFTRAGSIVEPYRRCIELASEKAGIALKFVYLPVDGG